MLQDFLDLLSGAGEPVLLSLAIAGVLSICGGILFLLLSGGVHFSGFHPSDPITYPNSPRNLRRIGIALIAVGLPTVFASAFLAQWDAGSVRLLSDDLTASREKVEKLSQEIRAHELEITALKQSLIQERNHRQKIESQLSEADIGLAQSRQELADARANIEAEYANRIDELSQTVDALKKNDASTEQRSLALRNENQKLASNNESLRADQEASEKRITELEMALADAKEKLGKAVGKDADGAEAGRAAQIFGDIDRNAGDYLALLLYQNQNTYFDSGAAIRHIAYAISEDLSFLGEELKYPEELRKKIRGLLENYRSFKYVDGKRWEEVGFYYLFRISSLGKVFFRSVVERYKADTNKIDFVERLQTEPQSAIPPRATGPGSKASERPDP